MAVFVSAGVYVQEKDDSLYAPAVAPTQMGLIGTATKGPTNEARVITNRGQLLDVFGLPRAKDKGILAAIEALKNVNFLYYVRIAGASAAKGKIDVEDDGSGATPAQSTVSSNGEPFNLEPAQTIVINIQGPATHTATVNATAASVTSNNTGTYDLNAIDGGNPVTLTVAIDGESADQTITFDSADALISSFNAVTVTEVVNVINDQIRDAKAQSSGGGTTVDIISDTRGTDSSVEVTGGNANDAGNGFDFPTAVQNGGGNVGDIDAVTGSEVKTVVEAAAGGAIVVNVGMTGTVQFETNATGSSTSLEVDATSTAIGSSPLIDVPTGTTWTGADSVAAADTIRFEAKTDGSHSEDIDVVISDSSALSGAKKLVVKYRDAQVEVYDKLYKGTTVSGGYEMIDAINNGTSDGAFPESEYITASDLDASGEDPTNGTHTLSAGDNGDDWTAGDVVGTTVGGVSTGMQIFANPDDLFINILAAPGISYASVITAMLDLCQGRADCMAVIDSPFGLDPEEVVGWHNGDVSITATVDQESRTESNSTQFASSYGALYYPFVQIFSPEVDDNVWVPPSAVVLKTIGYTDDVADPWFAPAGPNRTQGVNVLDLEFNPDQGFRDLMQVQGNNVNPLAVVNGVGVEILGQKTLLRTPSALDRVNVRRMLLAAEKIVATAVHFLIFEPNDPVMWRRFINLVTPVFEDFQARRGVREFRVVADSTTTPDSLIDQNTFLGKIFIKPTKAAERLIVSFNLVAQGANFEEFAQA